MLFQAFDTSTASSSLSAFWRGIALITSASIICLTIFVVVVIVYRLTLHPLAKYPGPFWAKITDWYSVYHAWKCDRHIEFYRCHEKYGSVFRFGPNSLSFNTESALKEIYGFKANNQKSQFYSVFPATKDAFSTHSCINKTIHARKRRVLSQAFSDSAIKAMENHMLVHIRKFCAPFNGKEKLVNAGLDTKSMKDPSEWGPSFDIGQRAGYLSFDVMGDLCFGKAFEVLDKPDNRFVIHLLENAARRHNTCGTLPIIHEVHLDKILFPKISSTREVYMKYSKKQAGERTKLGLDADRKDFFYYLLKAKDPETGKGFATSELWGESNLLIIAGSDTTSTALASTFFYLLHNPQTLSTLTKEIRRTFSNVEDIHSGPTLNSCTYLRACIDEAMRLSPPVGGLMPREVLTGGMEIDGHFIPAGTVVGVPIYGIHHNPSYYPQPFSYIPERWINDLSPTFLPNSDVHLAQSVFCPFSQGPRGCIGKGMAYVELLATVARTVFLYDMRLTPGTHVGEGRVEWEYGRHLPEEYQLRDIFTSLKEGPMVQFRKAENMIF
ncbi:MAG: hypothetical protein M1834_002401 [Cirrosporium novae-zelandiae]|nr:MAG: hypothetical protein M1834_002401 [Cirrosporium novae-zelandiae]